MKKLIFTSAFIFLFAGMAFSQSIKKGNLLGIHVVDEMTLKQGVSSEQAENFFYNTYIPALQKNFSKIDIIPMKGIRGEHGDKMGLIIVMKSEKDRSIYWNEEGSLNETGQSQLAKMQPVIDEMTNLMTSTDVYTDWLVK